MTSWRKWVTGLSMTEKVQTQYRWTSKYNIGEKVRHKLGDPSDTFIITEVCFSGPGRLQYKCSAFRAGANISEWYDEFELVRIL